MDHIYVANYPYASSRIQQYTTFTSCSGTIGNTLAHPRLCGVSVDGSLLIVRESEDHRVIILTADGQWHSLHVADLNSPYDAWVENNNFWVYDLWTNSCKQYLFQ